MWGGICNTVAIFLVPIGDFCLMLAASSNSTKKRHGKGPSVPALGILSGVDGRKIASLL